MVRLNHIITLTVILSLVGSVGLTGAYGSNITDAQFMMTNETVYTEQDIINYIDAMERRSQHAINWGIGFIVATGLALIFGMCMLFRKIEPRPWTPKDTDWVKPLDEYQTDKESRTDTK